VCRVLFTFQTKLILGISHLKTNYCMSKQLIVE